MKISCIFLCFSALMLVMISAYVLYRYIGFWQGRNNEDINMLKKIIITVLYMVSAYGFFLYGKFVIEKNSWLLFCEIPLLALICAMAFADWMDKIIPNHLIAIGLMIWIIKALIDIEYFGRGVVSILKFSMAGGFIYGGLLALVGLLIRNAIGMGDAKMFFVLGLFYGPSMTYLLLLSTLISMSVVAIALLIAKKADRKTTIPMAPFVTIAYAACMLIRV